MPNVGELGEQLVSHWLQTQNWVILHHRWRCRWGEIDLIAQQNPYPQAVQNNTQERKIKTKGETEDKRKISPASLPPCTPTPLPSCPAAPLLAFVEVKTRSRGNWDADGLLAVTPLKQAKLWQTAQLFLAENPDLATLPCRFDVALVNCQRPQGSRYQDMSVSSKAEVFNQAIQILPVHLGEPILVAGYRLILQNYIEAAFG